MKSMNVKLAKYTIKNLNQKEPHYENINIIELQFSRVNYPFLNTLTKRPFHIKGN
jgi:hypothetical protein